MGLVTAAQAEISSGTLDQLADACDQHLDIAAILEATRQTGNQSPSPSGRGPGRGGVEAFSGQFRAIPQPHSPHPDPLPEGEGDFLDPRSGGPALAIEGELVPPYGKTPPSSNVKLRLGIARDEAFHFYYADNLESLAQAGVEWVSFSPLADAGLPAGLDGLYFGGGYPEVYAARLSDNAGMLADVREFAAAGGLVYAECGGLMYLGRAITTLDGTRHTLAGVLPIETAMLQRLKMLGYAEVILTSSSLWGAAGDVVRGHEFHYSEITAQDAPADGWQPAYTVCRRRAELVVEGLCRGRVLAGYVHLHWASRPQAIQHFIR